MADEEEEFAAFEEEMLERLNQSVEGFEISLPMREAFGAAWDLRVQTAYTPAPRRSISEWDEFFLATLIDDDGQRYVKRCDNPPEVMLVIYQLISGDLDPASGSHEVLLHVPDDARRHPEWQWGPAPGSDALPDRVSLRSPW